MTKRPEINERGIIETPFRHDGPWFVGPKGNESYETNEMVIAIHGRGNITLGKVDKLGAIEWTHL